MPDKLTVQQIKELINISWRNWALVGAVWSLMYWAIASINTIWLSSITFDIVFYGSTLLGGVIPIVRSRKLIQSKNISHVSVVVCILLGLFATTVFCYLFAFLFMIIFSLFGMH